MKSICVKGSGTESGADHSKENGIKQVQCDKEILYGKLAD